MKKDRNCNMAVYPGMMPGYGMGTPMMNNPMMGMPIMGGSTPTTTNTQNNYGTGDLGSLTSQVNSLEQRINRLESIVNGSSYTTNYNPNNFQMM